MLKDVFILDACRTAVGKFGGSLKSVNADELARVVMKASMERSNVEPGQLDSVVFGHCRQNSDMSNTARYAALRAGIPAEVPANTVMCACASGMLAVNNGFNSIRCGQEELVLAGGTESMTNAIFYLSNARWGLGTGDSPLKDSLTEAQFCSQPQDIYGRFNMGLTAENIADRMKITREEQDAFALMSQTRAAAAIKAGRFVDEIVPVTVVKSRKAPPEEFLVDEFPRETTAEGLAKLKPAFRFDGTGTVTAGNASGRNDGASAIMLASEEAVKRSGKEPLARVISVAAAGVDPRYMGLGPVGATEKALKAAGMTLDDMELIELNEAFAAQSIGCLRQMHLTDRLDVINVNGGAIALGHPIGSSGSRIIVTLVHEMKKRGLKYGLATLCVAGGMGMATVVEVL